MDIRATVFLSGARVVSTRGKKVTSKAWPPSFFGCTSRRHRSLDFALFLIIVIELRCTYCFASPARFVQVANVGLSSQSCLYSYRLASATTAPLRKRWQPMLRNPEVGLTVLYKSKKHNQDFDAFRRAHNISGVGGSVNLGWTRRLLSSIPPNGHESSTRVICVVWNCCSLACSSLAWRCVASASRKDVCHIRGAIAKASSFRWGAPKQANAMGQE